MVGRAKVSRRWLLRRAGAAAGAAGLLYAGCGGGTKEQAQPAGGSHPKQGGTICLATTAPILSLDPHDSYGNALAPNFYSYIVWATEWEGNVGDLAESWEVPDEINWTFKLRGDARFQDIPPVNGRLLVAEDASQSIQRIIATAGIAQLWHGWVDETGAPDDHTLTIRTSRPWGDMIATIGASSAGMIPRELVEQPESLKDHVIGSGPFMLGAYGRDSGIEAVRNPTYYHDYPYVDGITGKVIVDDGSIQATLRAGSVNAYAAPNKLAADTLANVDGVAVQRFLGYPYTTMVVNANMRPEFKDERVREAVDLSLDRKRIIEKLYFGDAELAGPVGPVWTQTALPKEEVDAAYQTDIQKAKQLLAAAGAEDLHFTLIFPSTGDQSGAPADLAAIIKDNLAKAGITADLKAMEFATWLAGAILAGNVEATSFGHWSYPADIIPLQMMHSHGFNRSLYFGIDDPEVDALLEKIQQTLDRDEHQRLAWQAQRLVLKRHGPHFVLCQPYGYWCAYDYIKGYKASSFGFGMFKYDFWIDKA